MNLHIGVDNQFVDRVYTNIKEAGLDAKNKFIIRTNETPQYVKRDVAYAPLYSSDFSSIIGNTLDYERVIIHQFSPMMFRWVSRNSFHNLAWAPWGVDLYDLPFVHFNLFEKETYEGFVKQSREFSDILYRWKYWMSNSFFKNAAYSKVNDLLTWMKSEHTFAHDRIPSLKASYKFFFYENPVAYRDLRHLVRQPAERTRKTLKLIIGNSATPTNNHVDAVRDLSIQGVKADLFIPISYGNASYARFLKTALRFYKGGQVEFVDTRMDFNSYLNFLNTADALVMNNIRPQGYGNIFIMLFLGKPVFLNINNTSLPDIIEYKIPCLTIDRVKDMEVGTRITEQQLKPLADLLSHERNLKVCSELFS